MVEVIVTSGSSEATDVKEPFKLLVVAAKGASLSFEGRNKGHKAILSLVNCSSGGGSGII